MTEKVNCGGCSLRTSDAYCRVPRAGNGVTYLPLPPFGARHRDCPLILGTRARALWAWQRLVGR